MCMLFFILSVIRFRALKNLKKYSTLKLKRCFMKITLLAIALFFGVFAQGQITYNFTNAGATGRLGPTQAQINTAYSSTNLNGQVIINTQGIQEWTVPVTGDYKIETYGAQGGFGVRAGGLGAYMSGTFTLTAGQVIKIAVGQQGILRPGSDANSAGPGGGGSFVVDKTSGNPIIIAGGGGGGGFSASGLNGVISTSGTNGASFFSGYSAGAGGINGGGGGAGLSGTAGNGFTPGGNGTSCSYGVGGGGFYSRGGLNCDGTRTLSISGFAFVGGNALGGVGDSGLGGTDGGFGGGAGVGHRASGGGGYSGGGGDANSSGGGGGGSYNSGTNQTNIPGVRSGNGSVVITLLISISNNAPVGPHCAGDGISIPYTIFGTFNAGNVFTAQLSNAVGSFSSPVNIGSISSTSSGTISATIPAGSAAGTGYRIRVVSSNPIVTGTDNGNNITINTVPVITCPSNFSVTNTPSQCGANVSFTGINAATATGSSPSPTITYSPASGSFFPIGTTTVTATATNGCGTASCNFTVMVNDTENPTISCPSNISVNAASAAGAVVNYTTPVGTDNCAGAVTTRIAGLASGSTFPIGTTTVTHTVTDASGNTEQCSFTVTVSCVAPQIVCPANITINNTSGLCGATVTYPAATATGIPVPVIAYSHASGSLFPVGTTTVTATATSSCGTVSCSFTITVNDNQPPVFGGAGLSAAPALALANIPEAAQYKLVYQLDIPQSSDYNNTAVPYTINNSAASGISYNRVAYFMDLGSKWVWVSMDKFNSNLTQLGIPNAAFNNVAWQQAVSNMNVQGSAGSGVTNATGIPGNIEMWHDCYDRGAGLGTIPAGNNGLYDFNDSHSVASCYGSFQVHNYGAAQTIFAYNAWDYASANDDLGIGNQVGGSGHPDWTYAYNTAAYTTRKLYILVNSTGCAPNQTVNTAPGQCTATATYSATATDNCGTVTYTYNPPSGSVFNIGTTPVTVTATDGSNNSTSCTFNVTVVDKQAPVLTCPAPIVVNTDLGVCGATATYTVTSTDNCPGQTVTQTAGLPSGNVFPVGVTTNSFLVTDASGNTATCSFTVTVNDNELPVIHNVPANITLNALANNCSRYVTWTAPTATDNCGVQSLVSSAAGGGNADIFPVGVTTVTYTATDIHNNISTASFTVTVLDNQPPTITGCPANITVNASNGTCGQQVSWNPPTASDNCSGVTFTTNHIPGEIFPVGTTVVTYTATDASNNVTTCSFNVVVVDNQNPVITCPANISVNNDVNKCGATVAITPATATDNCGVQSINAVRSDNLALTADYPVGTTTITWTATDVNGRTSTCMQTVTVIDAQNPTITCPAPIVKNNDAGQCGAVVTYTVTSTDNCSGQTVAQTAGLPSGSFFPKGVTTNTFVVTDASGNTATCSFTVTVNDTEKPTITCPAPIVKNNDAGQCGAVVTYTVTSTDNCPGQTVAQTAGLSSGSFFPKGVTTNTFVVTDASGNTATCSFTVTVNDAENPTITCPAPIVKNNDAGQCGAVVTYTVASTDNCPGQSIAQTAGLPSGSFFPRGVTTNTFVVTDASGNTATCSFTVTVNDTEPPVITCPANISVNNNPNQCGAIVNYAAPVGTDNCPGAITTLTAGLPPGSLFPVGTTTVTYTVTTTNNLFYDEFANNNNGWLLGPEWAIAPTAINNCGNSCIGLSDPQFDHSGSNDNKIAGVVPGGCASTQLHDFYFLTSPAINTNVPGTVMMEYWRHLHSDYPGYAVNIIEVFNGSTWVRLWQEPPSGNCFNDLNWTLHGFNITAYKNANFRVRYGFNITSGGVYIMPSWSIDDFRIYSSGTGTQSASCSFTVTVTDNQNPTISCPAPISVNTNPGLCGATVNYTVNSADNCPGKTVVQTAGLPSGSFFPKGVTTNTFVVTDASGNTATCSFTVTVNDTEKPTITCNSPIVKNNDQGQCGAVVTYTVTSTDNCPGQTVAQIAGLPSGSFFPEGITTNTFVVTDASGNTATCSFTVTVNDTENPTITCNAPIVVSNDEGQCGAVVTYTVTSTDNCPGQTIAQTAGLPSGSFFPVGVTTNSFRVTDASGNTGTCSFTVTVTDNELPSITCAPNQTQTADEGLCNANVIVVGPATGDNCGVQSVTNNYNNTSNASGNYPVGTTTVMWTVTDIHGNTSTCTQTITVTDNEAPSISCAPNQTQTADEGVCNANVTVVGPATGDNCGVQSVTNNRNNTSNASGNYPVGTTTVIWTVTDIHGNTSTCTQTITVTDNEAPSITCAPNQTQTADEGVCNANVIVVGPATGDNCGVATVTNNYNNTSNASGNYPVGTTTVIWTVTDIHGNTNTCTQTITVIDNEAPSITCAPNQTQTADAGVCSANVTVVGPSTGDNCGVATVTNNYNNTSNASGIYPVGTTTVIWTVTDIHGNQSTCTQNITVTDNETPLITCPANVTVNCQDDNSSVATGTATATDNCTPAANIVITQSQTSTYSTDPSNVLHYNYVITRTWRATDVAGNFSECNQTIAVHDVTAPVITCPVNVTVNCLDDNSSTATGTATATDNCAPAANIMITQSQTSTYSTDPSNVLHYNYVITRTWRATDVAGNYSECVQTITVHDVTAPVITCPANVTVNCQDNNTSSSTGVATGTDNCSPIAITQSQTSTQNANANNAGYYNYVITRTWRATDVTGNYSECVQTITVQDVTKPVITCPVSVTVNCQDNNTSSSTGVATGTDNCSPIAITQSQTSTQNANPNNAGYYNYVITRTWRATDVTGNYSECVQTITVRDITAPVALCKPVTITLVNGTATITASSVNNGSNDNCSPVALSVSKTSFNCSNIGNNTVTLTVTDVTGKSSTCTAIVTVVGEIPSCSITAVPSSTIYTGGIPTNLYLGYGPQSDTLKVSAPASGAPYSYSWSGGVLSNYNTANPVFMATTAGLFTYTVLVTNKYGCVTTCSVSICVKDIRVPGSPANNMKVYVCHNGNTINISTNAVPAHIPGHPGDRLGSCSELPCSVSNSLVSSKGGEENVTVAATTPKAELPQADFKVNVYPNPSATDFSIMVISKTNEPVSVRIVDMNGKVRSVQTQLAKTNIIKVGSNLLGGTYFAEVTQGANKKVVKLVKLN